MFRFRQAGGCFGTEGKAVEHTDVENGEDMEQGVLEPVATVASQPSLVIRPSFSPWSRQITWRIIAVRCCFVCLVLLSGLLLLLLRLVAGLFPSPAPLYAIGSTIYVQVERPYRLPRSQSQSISGSRWSGGLPSSLCRLWPQLWARTVSWPWPFPFHLSSSGEGH